MNHFKLSISTLCVAIALGSATLVTNGCTTTPLNSEADAHMARQSIDSGVDATLSRLYRIVPGSRELIENAHGVLVFPTVIGGSLVVGAQYGKGALREHGVTEGYYSTTGGSIGFQAGGQSKAIIFVFNTTEALERFKNSNGWTVGADATVSLATMGANASVNSITLKQPVVGYIINNVGLEAGVSLQGTKINRI